MKTIVVTVLAVGIMAVAIFLSISSKPPNNQTEQEPTASFDEEKEIMQTIEGQEEQTMFQLNKGSSSDYIIYVDESRYAMTHGKDSDVIAPIDSLPADYPEVKIEIRKLDESPEAAVQQMESELKEDFPDLSSAEQVTEPAKGYKLHGTQGTDSKSKVITAYIVTNDDGGSFVITAHYFLEAAEGHGARFQYMIDTFEVTK